MLAQPPPRPAPGHGRVVLAAVGDVLLDKTDPDPLAGIAEALGRADLVFANLEIPLSRRGAPAACKDAADLAAGREFLFRGPPEGAALLARAGVSVVSLANNHALDYGPLALRDTLTSLHAAGLATCGAGQDDLEAHGPAVVTTNGAAVAFLGYVLASALPPEHDWAATPSRSGLAVLDDSSGHVSLESRQTLVADVCRAAARADRVVVSLHGGAEGSALPTPAQREVAREAEAAGASVLIGHHPHVLQPAVFVGNLAAVFSLGNCVFPVPTGRDDQRQSAIAYIELGEAEASVRLLPVTLSAGRPHEAGADPLACEAVRRQITPRSPSPDA
jgi:poly-gamma-glutamate synthesis protein (capsule biosynthesis protein)